MRDYMLEIYQKLLDDGTFLCCSAGNEGNKGTIPLAASDMWKAIGSCRYYKGKPIKETFSSVGEALDYMSIDNLYANWDGKTHKGTSFASPLLAGMVALVQEFFLVKTGKKLPLAKLNQFIKDNCIDLGDKGLDQQFGYGLFVLPDPDTIDIEKYQGVISLDELFSFLQEEGELLEPDYWRKKIAKEDKLKWMFIKWSNAVRICKILDIPQSYEEMQNYNIEDVLNYLEESGYLLEPSYWQEKIRQEDKLKWLFFKWYNAIVRVIK